MNEIKPNCPYCEQARRVVKAGLNGTGSQRMRCQSCRRYFTPSPKPMGYDQTTREMALRHYLEGNNFRSIGRLLSVHYVSVLNWVNQAHNALPQQVADTAHTEVEETDELFTFIGKKTNKSTL